MRREPRHLRDLRPHRHQGAAELQLGGAFEEPAPPRLFRLVPDQEHGRLRVRQVLLEVREDAATRHHAARRDDREESFALEQPG